MTSMDDQRRKWTKNPENERVAVPVPDAGKFPRKGERGEGCFEEELPAPQREQDYYRLRGMPDACAAAC
jgi:hypothetical protein